MEGNSLADSVAVGSDDAGAKWPDDDPGKHWFYMLWLKFALDHAGDTMEQQSDWISRGEDRIFYLERQVAELKASNQLLQKNLGAILSRLRTMDDSRNSMFRA
jgi:hypothetical protein